MSGKNLVIVESPAKAHTIARYLGGGYTVKASMGHLRDLPKSKLGVDIDKGFEPHYQAIKGRENLIDELRTAAERSDRVYLATDPDREGEAISWHLKELLNLPDDRACRVTFNEITKNTVLQSMKSPRQIDMNLVDSQQARRILDRIVGYQLSPLLWRKVRRGLSAGRVQSVVTRMVVDRENEIRSFIPREYWSLDVTFNAPGGAKFTAKYFGEGGKKAELESEEQTDAIIEDVKKGPVTVSAMKKGEKSRNPSPPFTTSTMQQEASRKLGMTTRRTMAVAQQLYEGIEITGKGAVGLITYMRTDSLRISQEALNAAAAFIKGKYGAEFSPAKPRAFKNSSSAQDAHEAVRPTDVALEPDSIKGDLTADQYKLYRLIWSRFIASQMAKAVYSTASIDAKCLSHVFRANHQSLVFPGFLAVYDDQKDDPAENTAPPLPDLEEGCVLTAGDTVKEQHFTQPPPRYMEASLVKAMEENGVGRPSTYAATIATIQDREYVEKNGKTLQPTPLGEVVTKLLEEKFSDIVDVEFTANMEKSLDGIESGQSDWRGILGDFYNGFSSSLEKAEEELKDTRIKVPDVESDEVCDICGRKMVIKTGRFGRFLACPGFPECKFTKPIVVEMPGRCPVCSGRILKKTSKKGYTYYGCEKNPSCSFMTWDVPTREDCPVCGHTMFKKPGKGHKKAYCINEQCSNFTPEEKRGGYRKRAAAQSGKTTGSENTTAEETAAATDGQPAKKKAAKKTPAKTVSGKTAAKKSPARPSKTDNE